MKRISIFIAFFVAGIAIFLSVYADLPASASALWSWSSRASQHIEKKDIIDNKSSSSSPVAQSPETAATRAFPPALPAVPAITAESFLVRVIGEHEPLFAKQERARMKPASLTKMMTALIAEEELSPRAGVPLSAAATRVEEKTSRIPADELFSKDDMLRIMLVSSANDAAMALAEAVGRRYDAFLFQDAIDIFVARARARFAILGLNDTSFQSPSGLDHENHYTTAHDLFLLTSYIMRVHPRLWDMTREPDAVITSQNNSRTFNLVTTNTLLGEFPALIGGKTGLTDGAKETLMLLYPIGRMKDGQDTRIAVIIILASEDRFGDGRRIIRWLEQTFNK